ncbi:hypothetical protein [Stella sp.]|uniref:hypothetical protein n=1 Tax=Stella sp. TaxID=2912054 RepID=UPI0035AF3A6B
MTFRRPGAAALVAAALVAALLAAGPAAAQTPSAELLTRLLGPLAPQGTVGQAGDWEMAVADESYLLVNRRAPYGARFVSIAAPAGPLTLAAEVRSEPANAPADALVGAGLLFDVQGAGAARRFALVLVERTGEVALFRGDQTGVKKVEGRALPGASGFVRLAAAESAGRIRVTANGVPIAEVPATPAAGTRMGVAAIGPGRFAFRNVRLGADPVVAAAPVRAGRVEARLPAGWQAAVGETGDWVARGPDGGRIVWWPVRSQAALAGAAAGTVLAELARRQDPDLAVGPVETRAGGIAATLRRGERTVGRAWLAPTQAAAGGTTALFVLAAGADWTAGRATAAAGILGSLRLVGAPPSAAARARTHRWADPAGGFTAELPQGWSVAGGSGTARDGAASWTVALTSADGASRVFLGDPELPLFVLPTERLKAAGIAEGQTFRHGDGTPVLVARLMPGLGFAEVQGMRLLAGRCADEPKAEHRRRRADLAGALGRALMPVPPAEELEAGEVALSCTGKDGRPLAAYILAATDGTAQRGQGAWSVPVLYGFVAPREQATEALGTLGTLIASIRPSTTALLGRAEDTGLRNEAAARVAAAVSASWWSQHAPRPPGPRPITAADGITLEGDPRFPWLPEGPAPAADWAAALAP